MAEARGATAQDTAAFLTSLAANVEIRFCERFDGSSRIWNLERHAHDVFEFLFFLDGGATIEAGNSHLQAGLFDLVIYPPGVVHEERLAAGFRNEIYCFWVDLGPSPPFFSGIQVQDSTGEIRTLVEAIYNEVVARRPLSRELVAAYMRSLLLLVCRHFVAPPKDEGGLVGRCLGYLHEHYTEDFEIETMARAVSVSPSYLFRTFKKKMGMTPMHFRNAVRIEKARLLLCQSDRRIELVALELGFRDVKYFSHLFKQMTGQTPGAFRTANRRAPGSASSF